MVKGYKGEQKPALRAEIKVEVGETKQNAREFSTSILIISTKAGSAFKAKFRVQRGKDVAGAESFTTDDDGMYIFISVEPLNNAGKTISLKFLLIGTDAETSAEIKLPVIEAATTGLKDDPEELEITPHHDGGGKFMLFCRVVTTGGVGIKTNVHIIAGREEEDVPTSDNGHGQYVLTQTLVPGEKVKVKATVSGIPGAANTVLRRSKDPEPERELATKMDKVKCLFGTNNRRAMIFIVVAMLLWTICYNIGLGDPIFNPPTTKLSESQVIFNELASKIDPSEVILEPTVKSQGDWPRKVWFFSIIWTIFTLIYAPLSLRDEVAEGLKEGFEKLMDNRPAVARDPMFDRIIAWSGARGIARKSKAKVEGKDKDDKKDKKDFWTLFQSDMLSEIVMFSFEMIPSVLGKMFRR
jgi:hypothetical protein